MANRRERARLLYRHGHSPRELSPAFCSLAACLFFLTAVEITNAATYYVDASNGNDSYPGTSEQQPWKTLTKAGNTAQAGDTVLVKAGIYCETLRVANSGSPGNLITFKAYPGHECQGEYGGTKSNCQVVIDGENTRGPIIYIYPQSYVRIEGFEIKNSIGDETIYIKPHAGTEVDGIEIVNNYIHDNVGSGMYARGGGTYVKNFLVENNEIFSNGEDGIFVGADGATIRANNIHYNGKDGIAVGGQNILIENNKLYNQFHTDKHQDGLEINYLADSIIRYNILYDFTQLIYFPLKDESGRTAENVEIYGNVLYTDRYWTVGGGEAPGIFVDARRDDCIVRNVDIHSNTIGWVGYGAVWILANNNTDVSDIDIRDNIFFDSGISISGSAIGQVDSDYNLFYGVSPPAYEGSHSVIADPLFVDYRRHEAWNFHLRSSSSAIDKGDPTLARLFSLPSPFIDLGGHVRPLDIPGVGYDGIGAFDIGAYEYSGPTAKAGEDQSINDSDGNGSEKVTLDGSASTDVDGTVVSYVWTEGGSEIAWVEKPTVMLSVAEHTIILTVTDDEGLTDTDTVVILVKPANQAPIANAGPDQTVTDSDGNGSQQVTLNGSGSADPDGTIQSYVWTEGGTQIATGVNPTVTLSVGQHTITLTVTDNGGLTDTDTIVITVNKSGTNQPPIANAGPDQTVTDADGNGSEQVTLNSSGSSDPGGAIQSYVWREGGSQIATGASTTVTLSLGQHTITLTVSDNGGLTATDTVTITVNPGSSNDSNPPTASNCSPAPDSIQVPLNNLITLHIGDAGKGVDANSVTIKVNSNTVYAGNTANYTSAAGNCHRTGTKADYTFSYQPNEMFEFEQKMTVAVNATDLGGNSMPEYTYSFWTEMRSFGKNKKVSSGLDNLACGSPATTQDSTGNTYVVWHSGPAGSRDIYVAKLTEGAGSFSSSTQLTADSADQCNPAIALGSGDKLYVVWQDNRRGNWDVYMSSSADGVNWSAASRISDSNDNETNPAIALGSAGGAGIVWQQEDQTGNRDIYIATSSDGFATKAISQITTNASEQTDPAIAVNSANTVYVVWTDKRNGSNDIYGAASNSGPWTNVPIVNKAGNQSSPAIAAETAGSILHLLWVDDASGNSDIYYAATNSLPSSPVAGSSIIDDSSGRNQVEPTIAVTGSTGNNLEVFACWQDRRNVAGASGDTDLYFAEVSSDGATNIFAGDDSTNSNQSQPAIGVDAHGHPYLVWCDSRSVNPQIYYTGSTYLDSEALDSELVTASAGATVGTNPTNIASIDDVSVVVPAGACSSNVRITISKIENPQEFAVQCLAAYDFGPSGIQFNQPVTITIPYSVPESQGSVKPYWYNALTGALTQQGITDIHDIVLSPTLHALSFKTTHFTPFYVVEGTAGGTGGAGSSGGGGGCSVSAAGNGSIVEFLLPYMALAAVMVILKLHDTRERKARKATKSEY